MRQRFCFIGLGNPGQQYINTPHNIGFEWIDAVVGSFGPFQWSDRFESHFYYFNQDGRELHFLKPQTFMNSSGQALQSWKKKFPQFDSIFVILDDIDLPLGRLRFREDGGDAGHRGLRSIIECMGNKKIPRLRIGVGRGPGEDAAEYVLKKFSPAQKAVRDQILEVAPEHMKALIELEPQQAMNRINAWRPQESENRE